MFQLLGAVRGPEYLHGNNPCHAWAEERASTGLASLLAVYGDEEPELEEVSPDRTGYVGGFQVVLEVLAVVVTSEVGSIQGQGKFPLFR